MKIKKLLLCFAVIITLCLIVSLVLYFIIDLDSYRPRIETAASDAVGFDVIIKGKMGFVLLPALHVSLNEVKIKGRETDIASLEKVKISLKLLPLLGGNVILDGIEITKPEISLVRFKNGDLNVTENTQKTTEAEKEDTGPFAIDKIIISKGDIVYSDRKAGTVTEMKGVDVAIKDIVTGNSGKQSVVQDISFKGSLSLTKLTSHDLNLSDLEFRISAQEGLFHIQLLPMTLFGGKGKGEVTFDVSGKTPSLKIQSSISKLNIEEFTHALLEKEHMEGESDLSLNMSFQGKNMAEAKETMSGHVSLNGDSIVTRNFDIDQILDNYRKTQEIGALDIGAFFLAGPLGTAATKGYGYEELYRQTGAGEGIVKKFVSAWKMEKGIVEAEDVAFATRENRLAVKGKVDLVNEKYEDFIVAVIDEKGCAELTQIIYGPLNDPRFKKTSIVKSAVGSVTSIIDKTAKLISGGKCEAFYQGSIQHPQ
jgi:AsmA protein